MAVDPMGPRMHGVSHPTEADLSGSRGADGRGVVLPTAGYENPGPTPNLRGIEPNTDLQGAGLTGDPEWAPTEGAVRSDPVDLTSPLGDTVGPGSSTWGGVDASSRNSRRLDVPPDSFDAFGESYPANGGMDGAD